MRHQDKDPWSFPHPCFDTPSRTQTWTHWIDFLKWVVGAIILVLVSVQVAYAEGVTMACWTQECELDLYWMGGEL